MKDFISRIRKETPLIHCITNYVTVNDCANMLLACGASPLMADAPEEAAEITALCSALVLNIGTLNEQTIRSMFLAGERAAELKHPVVFDPVGVGASKLRTETAAEIMKKIHPCILRCNSSELKKMMNASDSASRGVDASEIDIFTKENYRSMAESVLCAAKNFQCVAAVSGPVDLIAAPDGRCMAVFNGHPMMPCVTGSGCMLSALTAAFAAVEKDVFKAACAAFCTMGCAGEIAAEQAAPQTGNATYRNLLIDAVYRMTPEMLEKRIRYEMF